jgi:hypothetical protein
MFHELRSMLTRTVGLQVSFVVEEDDAAFGAHDTKLRAFFSACITLTLGVMGRWVWQLALQHSRLAGRRRPRGSSEASAETTVTAAGKKGCNTALPSAVLAAHHPAREQSMHLAGRGRASEVGASLQQHVPDSLSWGCTFVSQV